MFELMKPETESELEDREIVIRPPLPKGAGKVELSDNSRAVLERRYLRHGEDGKPLETPEELLWRVAYHVALGAAKQDEDVVPEAQRFYQLLTEKRFFPNSPTFTGAGTPLGQLAACFVLPISDDMGRESDGIFQTLRDAALVQQTGGGNGFSFSRLRPKGSRVHSSAGQATGPVGFLKVYDRAFAEIAQGGTRRGANMAVLRVDHPDIKDFIVCKQDENQITNFNISVAVTDDFMQTVKSDGPFSLVSPGTREVVETVRAREIYELIVEHAHHNGEPGLLFLDTANRSNPLDHLYELEATNPCGEQWLGPYENCCLGSINLARHCGPEGTIEWEELRESVVWGTKFLDCVVDANTYVPSVPQLKENAHRARRIGLGIMGLADAMYHAGIRYGSEEAQEFSSQIMEYIRYHCMLTSIALAGERGAFPAIRGSVYDPENLRWEPPTPLVSHRRDFGRPPIDWSKVIDGIRESGIRNAAQTTIAPTGTIATVAGCEGYGCEPVFALAYFRHVNDDGKDLELSYTSPLFETAMKEAGLDDRTRQRVIQQVMTQGSCQAVSEVPENLRNIFVVSQDITAEEHVRMQASLQAFVDNSLSKTCNFPEGAKTEDVASAYMLAWELGCKGLTVYVTGSRRRVVLETKATAERRSAGDAVQIPFWRESKRPRPQRLVGCTYQVNTPLGKAFVTVNENGAGQPFEVFFSTSKAGSETAAVSEAMGRLISYILRVASPVLPRQRMAEVVRQLAGIGGWRPLGFGPNRVLSLPDGLAQALAAYLGDTPEISGAEIEGAEANQIPLVVGDLCPDCGSATVVNEEGCRKCYSCAYSEC